MRVGTLIPRFKGFVLSTVRLTLGSKVSKAGLVLMSQRINLETSLWWVSVLELGFQGRMSLRWYDMPTPDLRGF